MRHILLAATLSLFLAFPAMAQDAATRDSAQPNIPVGETVQEQGAAQTGDTVIEDGRQQVEPSDASVSWWMGAPVTDIARAAYERVENDGLAHPWQLNFQRPATVVMERLEQMNDALNYIMAIIVLLVTFLVVHIVLRFNAKRNPIPSKVSHHTGLEIAWTLAPILILIGIAIPSIDLHYYMSEEGLEQEADMTLKVTGYQWYWNYAYPDNGGFAFDAYMTPDSELKPGEPRLLATDNKVVVPVDTTVRVQMTAGDVIHAWAVPAFGVKRDAVPGRLNETWFHATRTGVFYGQCSELCGVQHAFMPIEIHVVTKDEFTLWAEQAAEQFADAGTVDTVAILEKVTATRLADTTDTNATENRN